MTAKEIAQYIIRKSVAEKKFLNNWKIQYLLYYIQQEFCSSLKRKAFDDPMVAWALGPVVVDVKKDIEKQYGPLDITKPKGVYPSIDDPAEKKIIDGIFKEYQKYEFRDLMKMEMKDPYNLWFKTYDNGNGRNKEIEFPIGSDKK